MLQIFNDAEDFYNLTEPTRISLIGKPFYSRKRKGILKGGKIFIKYGQPTGKIYIPIGLHDREYNYGIRQGIIGISEIEKPDNYDKWFFNVGVISPDDFDLDLRFNHVDKKLRNYVVDFICKKSKRLDWRYLELFKEIQKEFGIGEIEY